MCDSLICFMGALNHYHVTQAGLLYRWFSYPYFQHRPWRSQQIKPLGLDHRLSFRVRHSHPTDKARLVGSLDEKLSVSGRVVHRPRLWSPDPAKVESFHINRPPVVNCPTTSGEALSLSHRMSFVSHHRSKLVFQFPPPTLYIFMIMYCK